MRHWVICHKRKLFVVHSFPIGLSLSLYYIQTLKLDGHSFIYANYIKLSSNASEAINLKIESTIDEEDEIYF